MEENNCLKREEQEDEEDGEDEGLSGDLQTKQSATLEQHRSAWAPCVLYRPDTEVHHYAGQKIVIAGGFDSYAGTIWPAALALSHYLDTHHEQLNLVDKAVLEIGAGTGLVSVVAALLGAWVTATDLPDYLNNLRVNLSRNTRGHCRHTPQAAALTWSYDLESTYPSSIYHYDYVLGSDVVYHHDYLDELLATMRHFCKPGTMLIWANKFRLGSDLTFTENFKKAFHTRLMSEEGDMKIFMATCREEEGDGDKCLEIQDLRKEDEEGKTEEKEVSVNQEKSKDNEATQEAVVLESERRGDNEDKYKQVCDEADTTEERVVLPGGNCKEGQKEKQAENHHPSCSTTTTDEDTTGQEEHADSPTWTPTVICSFGKDIYHFVDQDIAIYESIDSFGAVMWPAALALCCFLDNNRDKVNLHGKTVLELGAGTGLVTIVASLLGASVMATDLPDVLSNLRANVMRNTRGRCRDMPQVAALSWSYDLESTYPLSIYRYDYVLAADVVYHHDYLDELLATMKHWCKPGTTLIWANKIRLGSDLTFIENFERAFHTRLLSEEGDMKIFMATCRAGD